MLMKNAHLRRFPHPSSLRRTSVYASFLGISGALHLGVFDQPAYQVVFRGFGALGPSFSVYCLLSSVFFPSLFAGAQLWSSGAGGK
jgi:hypothetical protein